MAKFAKIIQENNENILIKKFIGLFRTKIRNTRKERFSFAEKTVHMGQFLQGGNFGHFVSYFFKK